MTKSGGFLSFINMGNKTPPLCKVGQKAEAGMNAHKCLTKNRTDKSSGYVVLSMI